MMTELVKHPHFVLPIVFLVWMMLTMFLLSLREIRRTKEESEPVKAKDVAKGVLYWVVSTTILLGAILVGYFVHDYTTNDVGREAREEMVLTLVEAYEDKTFSEEESVALVRVQELLDIPIVDAALAYEKNPESNVAKMNYFAQVEKAVNKLEEE